MTVETLGSVRSYASTEPVQVGEIIIKKKQRGIFEYPPCAGNPGSDEVTWVPAHFLIYHFAKLLHATDEDLKKK